MQWLLFELLIDHVDSHRTIVLQLQFFYYVMRGLMLAALDYLAQIYRSDEPV